MAMMVCGERGDDEVVMMMVMMVMAVTMMTNVFTCRQILRRWS